MKLTISIEAQDFDEPAALALRQLDQLDEWMRQPQNKYLRERGALLTAYSLYHPDAKYDPTTRKRKHLDHQSFLWARWEALEFNPNDSEHVWFTRRAELHGVPAWYELGKDDFRGVALRVTAQLAFVEGGFLVDALNAKPRDALVLWRHLYWFTRFFRAMQRIAYGVTPTQWDRKQKLAEKTRAWKRDAWAYLLQRKSRKANVSHAQVAGAFVRTQSPGVGQKTIQDYYTERTKKSVGRTTPDSAK